jgi:hypothetical protein
VSSFDDEQATAFKALKFSGKKEDYQMWAPKFLSYANFKGFKRVLLGLDVPPPESEDVSKAIAQIL